VSETWGIKWTVTVDGGDILVERPSPYCTEHPWSYRGKLYDDLIAMVTPEQLAGLQADMVADLKRQLVEAEATFGHCTRCAPAEASRR
jgi:hypothetical protein